MLVAFVFLNVGGGLHPRHPLAVGRYLEISRGFEFDDVVDREETIFDSGLRGHRQNGDQHN